MANKPIAEIGAWLGMIEPKRTAIHSVEKTDPDEVIRDLKNILGSSYNRYVPGLFEAQAFRSALTAMPWNDGDAIQEALGLTLTLEQITKRRNSVKCLGSFNGSYEIAIKAHEEHWEEMRINLHTHLAEALRIYEAGQVSDDPWEPFRPKLCLNLETLKELEKATRTLLPALLFSECFNTMPLPPEIDMKMQERIPPNTDRAVAATGIIRAMTVTTTHNIAYDIKGEQGGHTLERRVTTALIREVLCRVPEDTKNRFAVVRDLLRLTGLQVSRGQVKDVANQLNRSQN